MSESSLPPTTRRGFLGALTVLLGGAIAALASVPVLGSLFSPLRATRPWPRADAPIPVGNVGDFAVGVPRRVELIRSVTDAWSRSDATTMGAAWVTRDADGTFTALSTVCPHLGCGVNMDKQRNQFACPCHTSAFALDGKRLRRAPPRGAWIRLQRGGAWASQVLVHYRRFKRAPPSASRCEPPMLKRLGDWLDSRTGYRALLHDALYERVLGGARWRYVFGSALVTVLILVQAVTGIALELYYSPSTTDAWASVNYIQTQVQMGCAACAACTTSAPRPSSC